MAQPQALPAGWVPDDSTFGARLALIRQAMGWTNLQEAAVACGVTVQTWRNWEAGKGGRMSTVRAAVAQIAEKTGCDYWWLLDGRAHMRQPPPATPELTPVIGPDTFPCRDRNAIILPFARRPRTALTSADPANTVPLVG